MALAKTQYWRVIAGYLGETSENLIKVQNVSGVQELSFSYIVPPEFFYKITTETNDAERGNFEAYTVQI